MRPVLQLCASQRGLCDGDACKGAEMPGLIIFERMGKHVRICVLLDGI